MSRSRQRLEAMRGVAGLRAIGTELARVRAAAARRDLALAKTEAETQQGQLNAAVDGWRAALSGGAFDPLAAAFWGQAVTTGEANALRARHVQSDCEKADGVARDSFGRATAYQRCADDLLKRARFDRSAELVQRQDDERADAATRMFVRT